jgi:hypothetical protein
MGFSKPAPMQQRSGAASQLSSAKTNANSKLLAYGFALEALRARKDVENCEVVPPHFGTFRSLRADPVIANLGNEPVDRFRKRNEIKDDCLVAAGE